MSRKHEKFKTLFGREKQVLPNSAFNFLEFIFMSLQIAEENEMLQEYYELKSSCEKVILTLFSPHRRRSHRVKFT